MGLSPVETRGVRDAELDRLASQVVSDGGAVLGSYRDPVGGRGLLLVALPIDRVEPTPYQRNASDTHVKRLMTVIEKVGRFLDPIIVIRLDVDERVTGVVERLKARGLTSPYLKAFVVARVNPIRFSKATSFDFDEVVEKMRSAAGKFNVERIRQEDVAKMGGAPPDEE